MLNMIRAACALFLCAIAVSAQKQPFDVQAMLKIARISEPQFGGVLIRQGDEEHYYRRKVWSLDRSPAE